MNFNAFPCIDFVESFTLFWCKIIKYIFQLAKTLKTPKGKWSLFFGSRRFWIPHGYSDFGQNCGFFVFSPFFDHLKFFATTGKLYFCKVFSEIKLHENINIHAISLFFTFLEKKTQKKWKKRIFLSFFGVFFLCSEVTFKQELFQLSHPNSIRAGGGECQLEPSLLLTCFLHFVACLF